MERMQASKGRPKPNSDLEANPLISLCILKVKLAATLSKMTEFEIRYESRRAPRWGAAVMVMFILVQNKHHHLQGGRDSAADAC